jgi:molybdopterin synthase catalytic subunit
MKVAVRVTARLFARLREQAGAGSVEVEVEPGATIATVYERVRSTYPRLEAEPQLIRPARNQAYADWSDQVQDGDEVAFIPPVSGGAAGGVMIEITAEPLDPRRLEAAVVRSGAGAICTFTGVVRDNSRDRPVTHLAYEAYPEMAEAGMRLIAEEIAQRWPQARVAMAHRVGRLEIGEASVVVTVSCPHRAEAFEACRYGIDRLKESVPIWKKEFAADGAVWIEGDRARPT